MSNVKVNWLITDHNITVNYQGQTHIVARGDKLADQLISVIKDGRFEEIPDLVSAAKRIEKFSDGNFIVKDGELLFNGVSVPPALGRKILSFSNEGLPYKPLLKFAENLQRNSSYRAVNELFQFLEKNDHPITENGCFIAYKRVRGSFRDIHSDTMDNSPGKIVEMPRNQVDEDSTQTCSHGLHVANWNYAHTQFASANPSTDIMLEVEVDPADVVSIPVDYNQSKMRVCRYKVLGVVDKEHSTEVQLRVTDERCNSFSNEEKLSGFHDDSYEEYICQSCGEATEEGYLLCEFCEESSDEESSSDEDKYPWDEELE